MKKQKRWVEFEKLANVLAAKKENSGKIVEAFADLEELHRKYGNQNKVNLYKTRKLKMFQLANKRKQTVSVKALGSIAQDRLNRLKNSVANFKNTRLKFPEKVFNSLLQRKLKELDTLTSQAAKVQQVGSGPGIVESYRLLFDAYSSFGNDLKGFRPPGKSDSYVKSFRKSMGQIFNPVLQSAQQYRNEVKTTILQNNILGEYSDLLLPNRYSKVKYWYDKQAVVMDRGGKR